VTRLANGNTRVACTASREVIELGRQGKTIREIGRISLLFGKIPKVRQVHLPML